MKHTQEIEITKNRRGWGVHTIQHWTGWPNPAHDHAGAHSLAWAIYEQASWAADNDTRITSITVKGKPYPRAKAEAAIRKQTTGYMEYTQAGALAALDIP